MIDESRQEQASLYVLGLLTEDEAAAFERGLETDPELRAEVYALRDSALIFAHSAPLVAPPADLRDKILTGFAAATEAAAPAPEVIPFPATTKTAEPSAATPVVAETATPKPGRGGAILLHLIPWAAAAALAVMLVRQKTEFAEAAARSETEIAATIARVENESRATLAAAQEKAAAELARERDARTAVETALAGANSEKTSLTSELADLREAAKIDRTRIAVLSSTAARAPRTVAVSVWSQDQQAGVLVVENLPALPVGRDYQLWVIDPAKGTPVSAGVFKVDDKGKVRIEFKPDQHIDTADKFAITVEKEGGSPTPTLDKMVGIGG